MPRPQPSEYNHFYKAYIDRVEGDDAVKVLESSLTPLKNWLSGLDGKDLSYRYATGKWTIAQVLQHMIDSERVFSYRAMCIGRGEKQPLPGFDENEFADAAPAKERKLKGLAEELITLRKATIILFRSLAKENALENSGTASNHPISVNALAFILAGHMLHHINIVDTRYI